MKNILLVGSSIFQQWREAKNVAPAAIVTNRAISGTVTAYWLEHLAEVLANETPDVVLFYCGSNDINSAISPEGILTNTLRCREIIQALAPSCQFAYFSIMKAPQKNDRWQLIDKLNANIKNNLPTKDLYIETNDICFINNQPIKDFYIEDGLHLTPEAYTTLVAHTRPLIASWLK